MKIKSTAVGSRGKRRIRVRRHLRVFDRSRDLHGLGGRSGDASVTRDEPCLDNGLPTSPLPLTALEFGPNGTGFGIPQGAASLTYNPTAQTLTVSVTATGVSTGEHAAHIHLGSCQSQGPVLYMLFDLTANSSGQIVSENRTITGVTSGIPATGWYLNLHQGTSQNILKNGQPTIFFRPLLCANL